MKMPIGGGPAVAVAWHYNTPGYIVVDDQYVYWTASTAIYFLLRRDADAAELDQVCPEEEEQPTETAAAIGSGPTATPAPESKLPADQAE